MYKPASATHGPWTRNVAVVGMGGHRDGPQQLVRGVGGHPESFGSLGRTMQGGSLLAITLLSGEIGRRFSNAVDTAATTWCAGLL